MPNTATTLVGFESDYLPSAFQLDSGSTPIPYTCKVQGVNVSMMPSGT